MIAAQTSFEMELLEHQPESETYRFEYDQNTTPASMAVVAAMADVMDSDPTDLEPLYASVDTDALDELFDLRDTTNGDISVTFTVAAYAITVYNSGVVAITPSGHDRTDDLNEGVLHK